MRGVSVAVYAERGREGHRRAPCCTGGVGRLPHKTNISSLLSQIIPKWHATHLLSPICLRGLSSLGPFGPMRYREPPSVIAKLIYGDKQKWATRHSQWKVRPQDGASGTGRSALFQLSCGRSTLGPYGTGPCVTGGKYHFTNLCILAPVSSINCKRNPLLPY